MIDLAVDHADNIKAAVREAVARIACMCVLGSISLGCSIRPTHEKNRTLFSIQHVVYCCGIVEHNFGSGRFVRKSPVSRQYIGI